ncbi:uncharacterized protein LOC130666112 [Microplitis mediator]|uniref:uncharacterized protein LOC130666112 n=1 Tax=Microplitis mediator TaxID=375433 RepID=UPI002556B574|nr:uncharacterized protein LOC130666112 [Microplitis mediator]
MLPVNSIKNSRRSSILKLPKKPTSSQNAESNSSPENSPSKLKRRVSFAEKKSVKEFVDSFEQGTVWDSTYEESDSSQMKLSHTEAPKPEIVSTTSFLSLALNAGQNLDMNPSSVSLRPDKIEFKFPTSEAACLLGLQTERVIVNPELLANKENMPEILSIETVESSFVEVAVDETRLVSQTPGFAVYCDEDENCLDKTNVEDVSMECTIVASDVPFAGDQDNNLDRKLKDTVYLNKSMEFTQDIPPSNCKTRFCDDRTQVFGNDSIEFTEAISSVPIKSSSLGEEKTQVFLNKSMEMTEVIPSSLPRQHVDDRTEVFHNKSMEMTEAIPSTLSRNYNEDRTRVFHNKSMEMTDVIVPLVPEMQRRNFTGERTEVFHNKSMELTQAVPVSLLSQFRQFGEDRTEVFHNKSMEITQAIPPASALAQSRRFGDDKTQVFHNNSMEMTQAILPASILPQSRHFSDDRTEVFHNKSMEITQAIPPASALAQSRRFGDDKTQVFHNNSMEMTQAILPPSILPQSRHFSEERTEFFQNKSMEITEAIPPASLMTQLRHISDDRTEVFHNKSMEMTQAILPASVLPQPRHISDDRTEFFQNKSMEITEAIPPASLMTQLRHFSDDRTEVFHNKSMEMTQAILPASSRHFSEDRTKFFQNKSMEITEAIPPASLMTRLRHISDDRTEVFHNKSMEMTQAIPSASLLAQSRRFGDDRTEVFHNKSMEMTQAIPPASQIIQSRHFSDDRTQVFHNKSMEITQAILPASILPQPINFDEEKTRVFHNKSMELTEAINSLQAPLTNRSILSKPTAQDLEIDHNYFMENTVSINPSLKRNYHCIADTKTPKSAVSSPNAKNPRDCRPPVDRKASMEALHRILHQDLNKDNDLCPSFLSKSPTVSNENDRADDSMEMTAAIPSIRASASGARESLVVSDTTAVEPNDSSSLSASDSFEENQGPGSESQSDSVNQSTDSVNNENSSDRFTEMMSRHEDQFDFDGRVSLQETPSFIYTNDADLSVDQDVDAPQVSQSLNNDSDDSTLVESSNLSKDSSDLSQSSELDESNNRESSTDDIPEDLSGNDINLNYSDKVTCDPSESRLKRSISDEDSEEVEKKKLILTCAEDNQVKDDSAESDALLNDSVDSQVNRTQDDSMDVSLAVNESLEVLDDKKINIPEIGYLEPSDINIRLQKLILRDQLVNRKLKETQQNIREAKAKLKKLPKKIECVTEDIVDQTPYQLLKAGLEDYAKRKECVWKIHTINPAVVCIEFYKTSLIFGVRVNVAEPEEEITKICIVPRVSDNDTEMLKLTDRLITRKIDCDRLMENHKNYADIPKLIALVTEQVVFVYDFYEELKKLYRASVMDIFGDIVSVTVRTKKMETIIKLKINIASFPLINPDDIEVTNILGSVRDKDVKNLIKNVKPTPKLLTLYINDVKQLLELLAIANSKI